MNGSCLRGIPVLAVVVASALASIASAQETAEQQLIVSIERIWDRADHSAFTDLARLDDYLYCTFREGSGHIPGLNGTIRVIRSRDGTNWESVALLAEPHVDLRDPKLSVTPDGRLMINCGASYYHGTKRLKIESRVSFSTSDGTSFSPPQRVVFPQAMISGGDWLWRVTWHDGAAWGCVQQVDDKARGLRLVRSEDGIHFAEVAQLPVDSPSETTLRFLPDGTMAAMIRCEGTPKIGRIGLARPPYTEWTIKDANQRLGGPNFIRLPSGRWLAGSRDYEPAAHTSLWSVDLEQARFGDVIDLPSGGDNSYPGMLIDEPAGKLYVSYYSSHQGRTAIYLATLRLDAVEAALGK